ncbi:hypothetical protein ACF0H5_018234 [Mactra antiquata]
MSHKTNVISDDSTDQSGYHEWNRQHSLFGDRTTSLSFTKSTESKPLIEKGFLLEKKTNTVCIYVYISHFLSAWGDRMWQFGVGLFLVIIAPESLLLTAVYGFVTGAAILLFGPMVGDWVDRMARLQAARISLIVQNLSIALCAIIIYIVIIYKYEIETALVDQWLLNICFGIIILVAVIAQLASTGNTIAVEKDWIVEICGDDRDLLAKTSAILKSIDLVTNIVAPIATGQIMAYASTEIGALFIGGWNVVSVFVEYYLLWKVYIEVPALRAKKDFCRIEEKDKTDLDSGKCIRCMDKLLSGIVTLLRGWKTYMKYDISFAGLGLATVYMTVLGFDNITVGFAYTQGIRESIMGGLMAAGALVGILGSFIYPLMRKKIGIKYTGIFGLSFQILFLCLCVASVWTPGSPFDLNYSDHEIEELVPMNISAGVSISPQDLLFATEYNSTDNVTKVYTFDDGFNFWNNYLSITLLMAGIIGARCGLWIADLTITQLFLETVEEKERGIVLGVQTALNQLMDMIKFIMVIVAPEPELFGLLVLISFAFVFTGLCLYCKYVYGSTRIHYKVDKLIIDIDSDGESVELLNEKQV